MQTSLEIGTIDFNDRDIVRFIQNKSIDEIKNIIVDLLKKQVKQNKIDTNQDKWGAFADRMSGLTTPEITKHIHSSSSQIRDEISFRDIVG